VKEVIRVLPILREELLNESCWWSLFSPQIGTGFSKSRAANLHRIGLVQVRDSRICDWFFSANEEKIKFGLGRNEFGLLGSMRVESHNILGAPLW
jgi:hypothetical protein